MQSSCLCPQGTSAKATGLFDGYLGSCKNYVQAQTQLATRSGLAISTAFCTSADVSPALATVSETTVPQAVASFTNAATVLSPMIISGGNWHPMWWAAIVLVGIGLGGGVLFF